MSRRWCEECQAERDAWHIHGDPLEEFSWEELLMLARQVRAMIQSTEPKPNAAPSAPQC